MLLAERVPSGEVEDVLAAALIVSALLGNPRQDGKAPGFIWTDHVGQVLGLSPELVVQRYSQVKTPPGPHTIELAGRVRYVKGEPQPQGDELSKADDRDFPVESARGRGKPGVLLATPSIQARPPATGVRFISAERSVTRQFVVQMPELREAHRREGELVEQFIAHLSSRGLQPGRLELPVEDVKLYNDIYVPDRNQLIEAKGDVRREQIRMAIGQLADYAFHMSRSDDYPELPARAILVPRRPGASIEGLLDSLDIALVWRMPEGEFEDNRGRRFTG